MADPTDDRRIVVEPSADQATSFAAELIKSIICEAVHHRGRCHLALAGGTTPRGLYHGLAGGAATGEVPWDRLEVFFGDERDVPQDHVESNFRMAQRTLLDHLPISPHRVHPMRGDAPDLAAAAAEYEQTVRRTVPAEADGVPRFDLVLLGMGADGHVASLFPNCGALDEREKLVTACFVQVLGRRRLTFTFPLLNAARNVILLVTGDDKAEAVADLLGEDPHRRDRLPAARVSPAAGKLILVLDTAAAGRTGRRAP